MLKCRRHLELVGRKRFDRRGEQMLKYTHLEHALWLGKVVTMEHFHVCLCMREKGGDMSFIHWSVCTPEHTLCRGWGSMVM